MKLKSIFLTVLLCSATAWANEPQNRMTDDEMIAAAEQLIAQNKEAEANSNSPSSANSQAVDSSENTAVNVEPETIPEVKIAKTAKETTAEKSSTEQKESQIPAFRGSVEEEKESSSPWMRMLLGAAVVIGLSVGLLIFAKKYAKKKNPSSSKVALDIISQRALSPKQNLVVVRIAGEHILLGATDHSINFIKSVSLIDDEVDGGLPQDFNNFLEDDFVQQPLGGSARGGFSV